MSEGNKTSQDYSKLFIETAFSICTHLTILCHMHSQHFFKQKNVLLEANYIFCTIYMLNFMNSSIHKSFSKSHLMSINQYINKITHLATFCYSHKLITVFHY